MAATLASGAFQGSYKFTGAEGPVKGKRMSNEATRAQLQVGGCRTWVWVGKRGAAHTHALNGPPAAFLTNAPRAVPPPCAHHTTVAAQVP